MHPETVWTCGEGYRCPNSKRPPGLEAQERDEAAVKISGQTDAGRAYTRRHMRMRVGLTRRHLVGAWERVDAPMTGGL